MENSEKKLVTPAGLAVDIVLMIAFSIYMYSVVSTHVPSRDPHWIFIWGCLTTACFTAIFWLALQMFRLVVRGQRERNAAEKK